MLDQPLLDTLSAPPDASSGSRKAYYFHDIRVTCQTNCAAIVTLLDSMLGSFPEPAVVRGEALYTLFCAESAGQFPTHLPADRKRTETVRLLTNTKLKYYRNQDRTLEYHYYEALPGVNAPALSVISAGQQAALTQLEPLEHYQPMFLRRYVFLLALGQLLRPYGFEPCHAAAITSPWDDRQGALIIGNSGCGKTTLSLGSAISGCRLLGDDIIMLRQEDSAVTAYAISQEVSVRPGSIDLLPALSFLRDYPADARDKRYCAIEQIRSGATRMHTPIRLLIFPTFTNATSSTITPMSKAATLQALIGYCASKGRRSLQTQDRLFSLLATLAEQARAYQIAVAWGSNDGPELVCSLFKGDAQ